MAIDILRDELITFDEAAALVPGRPHRHTVYRWHLYGRNGDRLETVKLGNARFTTKEELSRFLHNQQAHPHDTPIPNPCPSWPPPKKAKSNAKKVKKAKKRLAKAGI